MNYNTPEARIYRDAFGLGRLQNVSMVEQESVRMAVKRLNANHLTLITLYYYQGLTQKEIALETDRDQSTISKSLFGNIVYKDGVAIKRYGGALKKIKKIIKQEYRR